jgi:hypothetical protein
MPPHSSKALSSASIPSLSFHHNHLMLMMVMIMMLMMMMMILILLLMLLVGADDFTSSVTECPRS